MESGSARSTDPEKVVRKSVMIKSIENGMASAFAQSFGGCS